LKGRGEGGGGAGEEETAVVGLGWWLIRGLVGNGRGETYHVEHFVAIAGEGVG